MAKVTISIFSLISILYASTSQAQMIANQKSIQPLFYLHNYNKMRTKFLATCLAFMCLSLSFLNAQTNLWQKDFDKNVNFIKMTEVGVAIVGTDEALFGFDNKGNILWQNEKLKKVESQRVEILNGSELIFVNDKGLISKNRVINVLNGKEYVNYDEVINIGVATIIHPVNALMVTNVNQELIAYDIETRQQLWKLGGHLPFGIKYQSPMDWVASLAGNQPITYTSEKSAIMHLGLGHLAEYDLTTGQPKWQFDFKPYKLKKPGNGKGDIPSMPAGGFATMQLDDQKETLYFPFRDKLIAINAKTGQSKWDVKANDLGKVRDIQLTDQGIVVLNLAGIQLVDYQSGQTKWKKPLKLKDPLNALFLPNGDDFYAISKKSIVKVDIKNRSLIEINSKIKLEGNEGIRGMEIIGDQIILNGSQNIMAIDKNSGKVNYHQYFKAPSASAVTMLQNAALATIALAATMNSQRLGQQSASANGNYKYYQYTPGYMESGGSNTLNQNQFMYISTKFKDADAKGFGLARINKSTGEVVNKIIIGDRDPIYGVDEKNGYFFFKADKRQIACRQISK